VNGRRVVVMALVSLLGLAGRARAGQRSTAAAPPGLTAGEWQGIADTIAQQAYLKASDTTGGPDEFGLSVAISGDTLVVGAPYEASAATGVNGDAADNSAATSGAAYVFVRSGGVWTQQAYLKASNTDLGDNFGTSVAISEDSAATGVNGNQADNSGHCGAAYVFVRSAGGWSQQAYLKISNTYPTRQSVLALGDQFGASVAISGDTVVVGAYAEDNAATGVNSSVMNFTVPQAGAAYVFVRSGTTWSQQAYLKASDTSTEARFGKSVAIFADTAVVGAAAAGPEPCCQHRPGAAYVFARSGTTWSQQARLTGSNAEDGDSFGSSVAVSGHNVLAADTVVVGAISEDSAATGVNGNQADNSALDSGAAYVFGLSAGVWSQQAYLKASNTDAGDNFGQSVAVSGDAVVVGAPVEKSAAMGVNGIQTDNTATYAGAAYAFGRGGGIWSQQAYLKASNTEANDTFGWSVTIDGDTAVVGAYGESSAATGVNGNQADNTAAGAGAAYAFIGLGGPGHTLTITSGPGGTPNPVASGGTANLTVTAVDSLKHLVSYGWSASCPTLGANGSFSDTTAESPAWTAPANTTDSQQDCDISVLVSDGEGLSQSASYVHAVSSGSTTFGCPAIPTYASIDCRLDGLVASLNAAQDLGRLKKRLVKAATKARMKKQRAEGFVAAGKKKQEKRAMKKAVKALAKFAHKVGSRAATKLLPPGTRQLLTDETNPILADERTLLGTL
jgi:FG-GAP repeat protein